MSINSQNLGIEGEEMARKHLLQQGYEILETNWRFKKLEVDIISKSAETIVFVEVKTRTNEVFGDPEIFVNLKKQRFLVSAAQQYLTQHNIVLESRFDVIAIVLNGQKSTVNQIEGAFYPTLL